MSPPPLKPDAASEANLQALSTQFGDSCSAPILEPERSALLQEALADSRLQAVKAQLEGRGFGMNADEAQAVQLAGGEQLVIPFGQDAHLVWTRTNGQTAAVGLIRQGQKTLNISASGEERIVRFLNAQKVQKLLGKLREKGKFQDFEGKLHQKGKRVGKVRVLFDETNKIAILGIASEGNEEKIGHQVRIKVKRDKDDEPEEDAEPVIQGTACGQASGEAVATSSAMQPLAVPPGEGGDFEGGYEGPQICTSQWGYDYLCFSTTPMLSLSLSGISPSLTLPQTFITQQTQAAFTIWNSGGGRLTGTVSVPVPFSIVSGGSFSLLPGQPQEVVVRFSSGTAGSFSKSITISSNGGNATVTATAVAHKVSFSPASVDFGSGLFVMREQCNDMGVCGLHTEKVGLPIEKALTVKNEGSVSVTLTLSTAAPYKIVSVPPTLSPGQSGQVTVRFDPNESGSFAGSVQVGINGGQGSVTSSPMTGVAHKIEIDPISLDYGLVFVGGSRTQGVNLKNIGATVVTFASLLPEIMTDISLPFLGEDQTNPSILSPGQIVEVKVKFTPSTSGTFAGNVTLGQIDSLSVEISVLGLAFTIDDLIEASQQSCNALENQAKTRNATFAPGEGKHLLLYGLPCLTNSQIQQLKEMAEQDQTDLPPLNEEALLWDPAKVLEGLQLLVDKYQQYSNLSKEDLVALINGWIGNLITPDSGYYNPDFAGFFDQLRQEADLGLFWAAVGDFLSALPYVDKIPVMGIILETITIIYNSITGQGGPTEGRLTAANGFIVALTQVTYFYPAAKDAIRAILSNAHSIPLKFEALAAIINGSTLTGIKAYSDAGLTSTFFNHFLGQLKQAFTSLPVPFTFVDNFVGALSQSSRLLIDPKGYANMVGGFITLVDLAQKGWTINTVPAAKIADPFERGTGGYCIGALACLGDSIHIVATKSIPELARIDERVSRAGGLVTAFVHVEAQMLERDIGAVEVAIHGIITEVVKWVGVYGEIPRSEYQGRIGAPVVTLVSYSSTQAAATKLRDRLGNPSVPVVIVYVDENGVWQATCACPSSIVDPQEYANQIARSMGYAPGTKYDPTKPRLPEGELRIGEPIIIGWWPPSYSGCGEGEACTAFSVPIILNPMLSTE